MNVLRAIPLSHKILWAILIALSIMSLFNVTRVGASIAEPEAVQPTVNATHCGSWIYGVGYTGMTIGGGSGAVGIDYGYRRNGCVIEGRWVSCGGHTTLISITTTWCGFYQPSDWGKRKIHVGMNYRICSSPISGIGVCWDEYLRTRINRAGEKVSWGSGSLIVTR